MNPRLSPLTAAAHRPPVNWRSILFVIRSLFKISYVWFFIKKWIVHQKVCLLSAGRGEESFEQMLAKRDFAVLRMPVEMLHEEYRDGQYRVLRICKRGG